MSVNDCSMQSPRHPSLYWTIGTTDLFAVSSQNLAG
jgi:hypothetical protein